LVHPADVRPGPCGGQHPPVNKAAPPEGPVRAGAKGEQLEALTFIVTEMEEFARMATDNTIKLAEDVLIAVKHFKGELTAEGCRQALGKSYFFHGGLELGDFQCSPRGVKLSPRGEDFRSEERRVGKECSAR